MKEVRQNSGVILGIILLMVLIVVVSIVTNGKGENSRTGSVIDGQAYNSTTTYNGAGAVNLQKDVILKPRGGTVGSVVITGAVAGSITLYDATSTDLNLTTTRASTTIATFPVSTAANTYTIDSVFYNGLIVSFSSATALPTSTITWR